MTINTFDWLRHVSVKDKSGFFLFCFFTRTVGKKDNGDSAARKLNSTKNFDGSYMKFGLKVTRECKGSTSRSVRKVGNP